MTTNMINGYELGDWMGQFTAKQEDKLYALGATVEGLMNKDGVPCTTQTKYSAALRALESCDWKLKQAERLIIQQWLTGLLTHLAIVGA